jgi:hypothetical protein
MEGGSIVVLTMELAKKVGDMAFELARKGHPVPVSWLTASGKEVKASDTLFELGLDSVRCRYPSGFPQP